MSVTIALQSKSDVELILNQIKTITTDQPTISFDSDKINFNDPASLYMIRIGHLYDILTETLEETPLKLTFNEIRGEIRLYNSDDIVIWGMFLSKLE
jgi:hypothetical protein